MPTPLTIAVLACLAPIETARAQDQAGGSERVYEAAVEARLMGRTTEAIEGSRRVLAVRPNDVDARLNLALALIAAGRLDEAEVELVTVLNQAPAYEDARVALDSIHRLRRDPVRWRLDVSASYSDLSQNLPPWRESALTISRRTIHGSVSGTIEHAERFRRQDTYFEGRLDRSLGRGSVYGAVGGTPNADFRPEIAVRGGGQAPVFGQNLSATLDVGVARYAVGVVSTVQPGVEYTTSGGALTVGARWIHLWDERDTYRSGYSLRALLAIRPSVRVRAGFADAPESSDGLTVDVRAASLGAEVDVNDRLTLRLNGLKEDRAAYDRDEITLGVGVRF
ncbi:MAG TPA: tetratricopeptide repeat protein [Brevundimonas sp.]|jgi:YaiO family outer membrane protein